MKEVSIAAPEEQDRPVVDQERSALAAREWGTLGDLAKKPVSAYATLLASGSELPQWRTGLKVQIADLSRPPGESA